jgi:Tripartite tricarboxylate transporter family receptor
VLDNLKKFGRILMASRFRGALLVGALAWLIPAPSNAQSYPSRPITIVVGYTPGAVSDLSARTISEGLNAAWGQPVIVDNRPGSGSNIAGGMVARAPADGYTLMVGTDATLTSNVFLYRHTPFDPVKDFAPVMNFGANIICLAVNADLPIKSVADVIAYAKANPGKLSYGSSGAGSPHHLAGELLHQKAGIEITHIPYKGGGAAVTDLLGGHKDPLRRDARRADHRRNRSGFRDVVLGRAVRARRYAAADHRAAQRGDRENPQHRERQGEARQSRSRRRGELAGRACGNGKGRAESARRTGEGRRHPAGMTLK